MTAFGIDDLYSEAAFFTITPVLYTHSGLPPPPFFSYEHVRSTFLKDSQENKVDSVGTSHHASEIVFTTISLSTSLTAFESLS